MQTKVVNRGGEDRNGGRRQSQPTPLMCSHNKKKPPLVCSHNKKKPAAPARAAWLQGPYCSLQLLTTASDGGLNQNGKRGRDMVAQVACHDVQVNYMESKHGEHLTLYMRKRLRHGSRCTGPSEKFEVPKLCYEI